MDAQLLHLCPKCGESYYAERYRTTTCVGWTPIYKDGVLINTNPNKTTVHCTCINCHEDFSFTEG